MTTARQLTDDEVRILRMRAQRLEPRANARDGVVPLVQSLCAVQAQDHRAATLALRARCSGLTAGDVESAFDEGSLVRTWVMRGTLHFVTMADLAWMQPLFGPAYVTGSRRRREQLGLDDETAERGVRLLRKALEERSLTRAEIVEKLAERGMPLEGQAVPHLIGYAASVGVLAGGGKGRGGARYRILDETKMRRLALSRRETLAELVRRYLRAFAPASMKDFAAWTGLPAALVKEAWQLVRAEIVEVETPDGTLTALAGGMKRPTTTRAPVVRLVPAFDNTMLGYASRALVLPQAHAKKITPGGGLIQAAVIVDGRAVARWRTVRTRSRFEVCVEPFTTMPRGTKAALQEEIAGVERFLARTLPEPEREE